MALSRGGGRWLIRNRNLPRLDTLGSTDATEESKQNAKKVASGDFANQFGQGTADLEPRKEIYVEPAASGQGDGTAYLTWTLVVRGGSRGERRAFRYWVDARGDPQKPRAVKNLIFHVDGKVTGTLWGPKQSPLAFPNGTSQALANLEVERGGITRLTGGDGSYVFSGGTGAAALTARLAGPFCVVSHDPDPDHPFVATQPPAAHVNLDFRGAGQFQLAQVSAFFWVNAAHDFASVVLDPLDVGRQLLRLKTSVNIDDRCNAFYDHDTTSLNFFQGDDAPNATTKQQCANTAYSDIAFHEYGHAIDDQLGGIHDLGYSEGFGDAVAIMATGESIVGRDFRGIGQHLRDGSQPADWPPSNPEPHEVGKIYASFTWTLIDELKKTRSETEALAIAKHLILGAAAADPSDIPDAVNLSFLVDDDDDDLSDGSPHFKELSAAADARRIPRPPDPLPKPAPAEAAKHK
jgi:hypothetical protein